MIIIIELDPLLHISSGMVVVEVLFVYFYSYISFTFSVFPSILGTMREVHHNAPLKLR